VSAIRVLLADDHAIVRSGLRLLLEREPDITVTGEAADGRAALDALDRETADVAVLDVAMPGLNGYRGGGSDFAQESGYRDRDAQHAQR